MGEGREFMPPAVDPARAARFKRRHRTKGKRRQERLKRIVDLHLRCPQCNSVAVLVWRDGNAQKPGRPKKPYYVCPKGHDVRVGCHPGTTVPLGTLADLKTRQLRGIVHRLFDRHWKHLETRYNMPRWIARQGAYIWLSRKSGIALEDMHIARLQAVELTKLKDMLSDEIFAAEEIFDLIAELRARGDLVDPRRDDPGADVGSYRVNGDAARRIRDHREKKK